MPIPKPHKDEKEKDFRRRCMGFLLDEGTNQKQAVAICLNQWRKFKKQRGNVTMTKEIIKSVDEDALAKFLASDKAASIIKEVIENSEKEMMSIKKIDEDERLVFGWFSVVEKDGKLIKDSQDDYIEPAQLEKAAYSYVLDARLAGDSHIRKGVGQLVESIVLTKEKQDALGIDLGFVGWWGGFHINDNEVWDKIKKGVYPMFSIGGTGQRVPKEV